jgi:hypothetical protein
MNKERRKNRRKALRRLIRTTVRKKSFWIECITLYSSILIATILVQAIIMRLETYLLIICLTKSVFTTIINVLVIIILRRKKFVRKRRILEILAYTISSMPYIEILIITLIKKEYILSMHMIQWYAITYFIMGIFIEEYLRVTRKMLTKRIIRKK